jgi:chromosome segregation ATPase
MRDGKLYKELGYQNFAEYCESETGIKISQAKKYVAIADHMDEKTASQLAKISTEKLYMLSMLDEPTRETVLESVDVENDTVRELRNEINRITSENADLGQKLDAAQETIANKDRQFRAAMDSKNRELECVNAQKKHSDDSYRKTHAEWIRAQNENAALTGKISDLEEQIKELENRPVEVAVSVEEAKEIERLKTELNAAEQEMARAKKEVYAEAQRIADEVRHNMQGVHESEMQALRDGYERQLAEESKRPDISALDRAKFYALKNVFENIVDELESFLDELHDEPRIRYINELDNYWTDNLLYLKREGEGAGA